jgi:16S rRNA (guanine527-N7)-methyltransferase
VQRGGFRDRLQRRLDRYGIPVPATVAGLLERYFDLLAKWNARINLTALQVEPVTDAAIDRLFLEPLAAARYFPDRWAHWFDLGSGGGSPAIPLRSVRAAGALTMVEAKTRKAAFLREVVRTLELEHVFVENARFEAIGSPDVAKAQVVTVRAVRPDRQLAESAAGLLGFEGRLLVFTSSQQPIKLVHFDHLETVALLQDSPSRLAIYRRVVPRGTSKPDRR